MYECVSLEETRTANKPKETPKNKKNKTAGREKRKTF